MKPIVISIISNGRAARADLTETATTADKIGGAFKSAAVPAAAFLTGLAFAAKGAVDDLKRIEAINAQTTASIKSTGGAANVTAGHVEKLAGTLEKATATEGELIQENANLLLTFTNVSNQAGKGNAIFDRAVTTFTDMQRAIPSASMNQLGKALNDPIAGIASLTKVGVQFTDSQKDQIKTLVESGQTMEAQKVILDELDRQFGGSGAAYAATTAGQAELAAHAYGELTEELASGLLPVFRRVSEVGLQVVGFLMEHKTATKAVVAALVVLAATVLAVNAAMKLYAAATVIATAASKAGIVAKYAYGAAWLAFRLAVVAGTAVMNIARIAVLAFNAALFANPIGLIVLAVVALVAGLVLLYQKSDTARAIMDALWAGIKVGAAFIWDAVKLYIDLVVGYVQFLWQGVQLYFGLVKSYWTTVITAAKNLYTGVVGAFNDVINFVTSIPGRITTALGNLGNLLKNAGKQVIDGFVNGIKGKFNDVKNALGDLTSKLTSWKGPPKTDAIILQNAGELVVGGFITGMESEYSSVRKSLQGLTRDVANTAFTAPSVTVEGTVDWTPSDRAVAVKGYATSAQAAGAPAEGRRYEITVQAVAPGAEVGRAVVDAIREFERVGGSV